MDESDLGEDFSSLRSSLFIHGSRDRGSLSENISRRQLLGQAILVVTEEGWLAGWEPGWKDGRALTCFPT